MPRVDSQRSQGEDDAQSDFLQARQPQLGDLTERLGQDREIGNDVEDGVRLPEGARVNAVHILSRFVPEAIDRSALEDRRHDVGKARRGDEGDAAVSRPPEPRFDREDTIVEAQDREFVERDDHFVHNLRGEEPLEARRLLVLNHMGRLLQMGILTFNAMITCS